MNPICFLIVFFFLKVHYATALNFSFPTFNIVHTSQFNFTPDADIFEGGISLTQDRDGTNKFQSTGRITYIKPLFLWDNESRILTNFSTSFTFSIDSLNNNTYADGMAFFLAPINMSDPIPGGAFGLPFQDQSNGNRLALHHRFVAVEFDTFHNGEWLDPNYGDHVGIDINSIVSNVTEKWNSSIRNGAYNTASISYDSISKTLAVNFTNFNGSQIFMRNLSYRIDLMDYLPEEVEIGFSAATGDVFERHILKSWNFSSTLEPPRSVEPEINRSSKFLGLVVGLSVGGSVVVLIAFIYLTWRRKNRREKRFDDEYQFNEIEMSMDDDFDKGTGPKRFSYNDLIRATDNFSEHEKLGEGGFGAVYRGYLKELNSYVAVKRVSRGSKQGIKEYASEVKIISRLRHRNLVQLMGWCHERMELLLVYEFMPNGSLDSHLFKEDSLLSWELRYQIALGLASGVLYLQEEWDQCVLHRDIKSSNIMLDSNFNTKLGDFGLAKLVDHGKVSHTTLVAGTIGYMAPEYIISQKASKESDVYSFGVVVLEIACGRKCIEQKASEDQVNIIQWVWDLYGQGNIIKAADPRLNNEFKGDQMKCLMIVGLWCVHPDPKSRPSIRQAIQILNFDVPLPSLPLKMPVPTYLPPPIALSSLLSSVEITGSSQNQFSTTSGSFATSSSSSTSVLLNNTR